MWTTLGQDQPLPANNGVGLGEVVAPFMSVFFAAFFVAILLTPLMRMLALRNNVIDEPDQLRKRHRRPIAYLGGVAIFVAWLAGVTVCHFIPAGGYSGTYGIGFSYFPLTIILGAGAITLVGLFDDIYGISPRVKVGGQLFAAAAIAQEAIGLRLVEFTFSLLGLESVAPWIVYTLGTVVIAMFVLGGCNAMNLLDGMDGLAAGITAIAALGFLVIAAIVATRSSADMNMVRIVMCLALLGAVLGFLPYNFNPASIFMGDAGSLLLGYLSVVTILLFAEVGGNGLLTVTAALIVFALPITDTTLAIVRRKARGQPILAPDHQHIHHLLRQAGLSVRQSVLMLYSLAGLFATLGIALVAMELRWRYVLAVFVVLYGFIVVTAFKFGQIQAKQPAPAEPARSSEPEEADRSEPSPSGQTKRGLDNRADSNTMSASSPAAGAGSADAN